MFPVQAVPDCSSLALSCDGCKFRQFQSPTVPVGHFHTIDANVWHYGSNVCAHIVEKIYFDPWDWDVYDIKSDAEIDFGKTVGSSSYGIEGYLRRSFQKYIAVYENAIALTSNATILQSFGNVTSLLKNYLESHSYIPYPDFEASFDRDVIEAVGLTKTVCLNAQSASNASSACLRMGSTLSFIRR